MSVAVYSREIVTGDGPVRMWFAHFQGGGELQLSGPWDTKARAQREGDHLKAEPKRWTRRAAQRAVARKP